MDQTRCEQKQVYALVATAATTCIDRIKSWHASGDRCFLVINLATNRLALHPMSVADELAAAYTKESMHEAATLFTEIKAAVATYDMKKEFITVLHASGDDDADDEGMDFFMLRMGIADVEACASTPVAGAKLVTTTPKKEKKAEGAGGAAAERVATTTETAMPTAVGSAAADDVAEEVTALGKLQLSS